MIFLNAEIGLTSNRLKNLNLRNTEMRKILILALTSLTLSFSACDDPVGPGELNVETIGHVLYEVQKNQVSDAAKLETRTGSYEICPAQTTQNLGVSSNSESDIYGDVTVTIFRATVFGGDPNADYALPIPDDYVLVGGGARINATDNVFFTASYPCNNAWAVRTRDYNYIPLHTIEIYAIGLQLRGVSPTELRKYVKYTTGRVGSKMDHPSISNLKRLSEYYHVLGGGFRVDEPAHFLTENYPYNDVFWRVKAKSHKHPSYSDGTGYLVQIQKNIPGFGYLEMQRNFSYTHTYPGQPGTARFLAPTGWLVVSAGARVNYVNGAGRLLTGVFPQTSRSVVVTDKDWWYHDGGTLEAHASYIRKYR